MPYIIQKDGEQYCVHQEDADGSVGERVKCHATEAEARAHVRALYANVEEAAAKYFAGLAIKAIGDWELDVLAIPFHSRDSDGQWFDENTDIMHEAFTTPLVVYQHGVAQGAKGLQERPLVIGKTVSGSLEKRADGWHLRVILDKTKALAKNVMEAARKGMVAVSSGAISHLARLDNGKGKLMQYEKNRPGRIAVWSLAEISLWEKGNGNMQPANQFAVALPAMKAMYREAGIPFPDIDTHGGAEADDATRRAEVVQKAIQLLKQTDKQTERKIK